MRRRLVPLGLVGAVALVLTAAPSSAVSPAESSVTVGPNDMAVVFDLVQDGSGATYLAGLTFGAFEGFTNTLGPDSFVAKVGPDGTLEWVDQFGSDGDEEGAYAIALGAGGVYVVGVTQGSLHGVREGHSDAFVRKYSVEGALSWGDQFHGPELTEANYVELATGVAVAGSTVYVTGSVDGEGFLRRYDSTGETKSFEREAGVALHDVVADGIDAYVVGTTFDPETFGDRAGFVRRYAGAAVVDAAAFAAVGEPMRIAINDDGVFAAGADAAGGTVVAALDRDLDATWSAPSDGMVFGVDVTAEGAVFVAGSSWETGESFLRKHAPGDGGVVWDVRFDEESALGAHGVLVSGDDVLVGLFSDRGATFDRLAVTRSVPVTRLAGSDRSGTALAVSAAAFPHGAAGAVLVHAHEFADAVVAGPLAVEIGAPILLVTGDWLAATVRAELERLLPFGGTVTIVGGTAAVTTGLEADVRALGFDVERLAGATRFHTAVAVADALGAPPAVIADGTSFADSLVAGAAAAHTGRAVLLSDGATLPPATAAYLARAGGASLAVGGPAVAAAPGAEAIAGATRYETAGLVADALFARAHVVGVASGTSFPDALTLTPLLVTRDAPLLLTPSHELAAAVRERLDLGMHEVLIAGGEAAVSTRVELSIAHLLDEARLGA